MCVCVWMDGCWSCLKAVLMEAAHGTQGEKYQKKATKKMIIIFLVLIVILFIFLLIFNRRNSTA